MNLTYITNNLCPLAVIKLRFVEGGRAHAEGSEIFIILDHVIIPASDDKCDAFVCKIA